MTSASLERDHRPQGGVAEAFSLPNLLIAAFGTSAFLVHVLCAGGYGYQRDELYFLACARHLAWGYVDQPPLIAVLAAISTSVFGDSLQAIRLLPALAAAATVVLTGLLARRLGAGLYGSGIAMVCVLVSPFFLYTGNLLTMNAFEPLFWTGAAFVAIEILDDWGRSPARWFALAAIVALGILNKYTMGFFALALLAGLLATPGRRVLRGPAPFAAFGLLAVAIAPNIWWQYTNGWPQIELLARATLIKNPPLTPLGFFFEQALMMNPATLPVWIAGIVFAWRARDGRYRAFAIAYALLFAAFVALHGKVYYLASIYPMLFAAGGSTIENLITRGPLRAGYALVLAALGIVIAPQVLPVLPLDRFVAYQRLLDFRHIREEQHSVGRVPQQFADMLGWDTFVGDVAQAYRSIPAPQRTHTAIWTRNYGMAAAVDVLGPPLGLPGAISGHNTYYLWGSRGYTGESVLAAGVSEALLHEEFASVVRLGTFRDPWLLPEEDNVPLYHCSRPRMPLAEFWPRAKSYI